LSAGDARRAVENYVDVHEEWIIDGKYVPLKFSASFPSLRALWSLGSAQGCHLSEGDRHPL
jgi:hypothetical protein